MYAAALTLFLLRTNTAADSWQGRGLLEHFGGSQELAALDILDECRYVDVHRATLHTGWFSAIQAALGLFHGHFGCEANVHFLGARGGTINGVELRHLHALNLRALLGFHALTNLVSPLGVAVGEHLDGVVGSTGRASLVLLTGYMGFGL